VYIHVITDGRDVTNTSALHYVSALKNKIRMLKNIQIASICGRYYAMDRNNNWDRIETFYKALVFGKGRYEQEPLKAISNLYKEGYTDEFFPPIVIVKNNKPVGIVKNMDAVIYFNFRADRARELTQAFLDKNVFRAFIIRKYPLKKIYFVSLTDYKLDLPLLNVAFPTAKIETSLAKILSEHNFKQLHVAESEKYAHVTYFFNGGYEKPFSGEDRIIVPSPKVKSYDQQPEMSIETLTNKVLKAIKSPKYDFILINFANVDMVGHTGNIIAVSRAVEIVDKKVAEIVNEVLKQNGLIIITADHGNAEQMVNITSSTKNPEAIHSLNPVPFILIAKEFRKNLFKSAYKSNELLLTDILSSNHTIADIAPTILDIFNIAKPIDMTGKSLIGKLE
ncbi:MAG: 2,3-bisphosphoglycerate-independent phosphoglycerate mutase, partial [Candidatus Woesearchaeota archaeon]